MSRGRREGNTEERFMLRPDGDGDYEDDDKDDGKDATAAVPRTTGFEGRLCMARGSLDIKRGLNTS